MARIKYQEALGLEVKRGRGRFSHLRIRKSKQINRAPFSNEYRIRGDLFVIYL